MKAARQREIAFENINHPAADCTHQLKAYSKTIIPFRRGPGFALDSKHGGHLQLGGGGRPQASHPLQQLPKDASQGPQVNRAGIASSGQNHLATQDHIRNA